MSLNEVIRTSGDVRRCLAQTMSDLRAGTIPVATALAIAANAKEITASLQVEVNVAKVRGEFPNGLLRCHIGMSVWRLGQNSLARANSTALASRAARAARMFSFSRAIAGATPYARQRARNWFRVIVAFG